MRQGKINMYNVVTHKLIPNTAMLRKLTKTIASYKDQMARGYFEAGVNHARLIQFVFLPLKLIPRNYS